MRFFFLLVLISATCYCSLPELRAEGKSVGIDSMIAVLTQSPDDTNKLIILDNLVESISDDAIWPGYNDQMGLLAKKLSEDKNPAVSRTAKKYEAAYLNNKAVLVSYKGDISQGIQIHHEALKLREELDDKKGITESLNNIGYALHQQGELQKALGYYQRALTIEQASGDSSGRGLTLNNIGLTYYTQKKYPEALGYYEKSLGIRTAKGEKQAMAVTLCNMGLIYGKMNDLDRSVNCFERSLKLSSEVGDKRGMAFSLTEIGNAYFSQGKTKEALRYATHAHELALAVGFPIRIRQTAQLLKKIYQSQGDYRKAYEMFELESLMRDSINNEETKRATLQQQFKYEFDGKEAAIRAAQEKKDAVAEQKILRQKIIRNALSGGVVLMLLLVLVLVNRYRLKQKSNLELAAAYDSLKATQQQLIHKEKLASLGQLTASIAHEIKNPLNFVNNFADLSRDLVEEMKTMKTEEEKSELISELEMNLSRIALHGRRADGIVKGMLHHSRSEAGLRQQSDLNEVCEEALHLAFHSIRSRIPDFNCQIEKSFARNLPMVTIIQQDISRVLLNILNNAFYAVREKSIASGRGENLYEPKISVTTKQINDTVQVSVRDNGEGIPDSAREKIFEPFFSTKPPGEGTGLGLSISYDIVKAHGGEIKVESKKNIFTEFVISLPYLQHPGGNPDL